MEYWDYKHPRSAAEYSYNCNLRRVAKRNYYDTVVSMFMVYSVGFFCGVMVFAMSLQMVA